MQPEIKLSSRVQQGRCSPRAVTPPERIRFLFLPIDLGDEAQVMDGLRAVLDRYGRIDCAANCAGVDRSAGILDYTAADFDLIFGTNVRGLFLCL
ncbi:SDR family oxidoreductase [Synechococcus sp. CBW1107]|nr:SDR family oxidoreductase [Synechococcus sp. CBW1107]